MTIVTCPCCNGEVDVSHTDSGRVHMEIVKLTKPTERWRARGSRREALEAIQGVCEANGVTIEELRAPGRVRWLARVRREAAYAAAVAGASNQLIGELLNRDRDIVRKAIAERRAG